MLPEKVNLFWNSQSNCNSGLEKYVRPQENPENQEWELAFGSWQNYGNQSPLEELGFQSMETSPLVELLQSPIGRTALGQKEVFFLLDSKKKHLPDGVLDLNLFLFGVIDDAWWGRRAPPMGLADSNVSCVSLTDCTGSIFKQD